MAQITVEDILGALDAANVAVGRLQLQRDGLLRETVELSRRIDQLTKPPKTAAKKEKEK